MRMNVKRFWVLSIFAAVAVIVFCYLDGQLTCGAAARKYVPNKRDRFSSHYGWALGPKTVYLRRGQTFTVNYEADIKRGNLHFYLDRGWYGFSGGAAGAHTLHAGGKGQYKAVINSDGWYRLTISTGGEAADLDYFATWYATWEE
jgi:hypothetical protein